MKASASWYSPDSYVETNLPPPVSFHRLGAPNAPAWYAGAADGWPNPVVEPPIPHFRPFDQPFIASPNWSLDHFTGTPASAVRLTSRLLPGSGRSIGTPYSLPAIRPTPFHAYGGMLARFG